MYLDPNSEHYILRPQNYEFKRRNAGYKSVPFGKSVGAKKEGYLKQFKDEDGIMRLNLEGKTVKEISQILKNLADV